MSPELRNDKAGLSIVDMHGDDGMRFRMTAKKAREFARWLDTCYAAWAESLGHK